MAFGWAAGHPTESAIVDFVKFVAAGFLFAGLWTSISAGIVAGWAFWALVIAAGDTWRNVLMAAIGVALSMTGPGVWSLDARLFAWRRITFPGPDE